MKRQFAILAAIFATAGLAACSAPSTTVMTDSGKRISLSPAETLQAYHWNLVNVVQPDGVSDTTGLSLDRPLGLSFLNDVVALQNLCNNMNASYQLDNNQIHFSQVVGTMMMCNDPALMQYERDVATQLPTATSWSLASTDQTQANAPAPVLSLHFENGATWRFAGEQTNETKYGSKAEIVFLEVAPQAEACPSGGTCLKVRPVYYNDQGLQTGHGDWAFMQPDAIQGYEHLIGVGTILRTKRYDINRGADGQSGQAYVLDMIVQSM